MIWFFWLLLYMQGAADLVEYFIDQCNQKLTEQLRSIDLESMTLRDKLKTALSLRLKLYIPFISTWPQVNIPYRALRFLFTLVSFILGAHLLYF